MQCFTLFTVLTGYLSCLPLAKSVALIRKVYIVQYTCIFIRDAQRYYG